MPFTLHQNNLLPFAFGRLPIVIIILNTWPKISIPMWTGNASTELTAIILKYKPCAKCITDLLKCFVTQKVNLPDPKCNLITPTLTGAFFADPINIFHGHKATENANEPIRLSYQRGSHYNSVVDPHKATVGVGLGLPNFSPGSADRSLVRDAIRQSEELEIEQVDFFYFFL